MDLKENLGLPPSSPDTSSSISRQLASRVAWHFRSEAQQPPAGFALEQWTSHLVPGSDHLSYTSLIFSVTHTHEEQSSQGWERPEVLLVSRLLADGYPLLWSPPPPPPPGQWETPAMFLTLSTLIILGLQRK